jgi:ribosomal-protein-alanine N-acetyltransferase
MKIAIKTNRLFIREYHDSDLDKYCNLLLDSDVNRYLGSWVPRTRESAKQLFIEEILGQQEGSSRSKFIFAVELSSTIELIGNIGFTIVNENSIADIGWIFRKQYWGFGYATEAAFSIINYAFINHIVSKFITSCRKDNGQSEQIMKKLKFIFDRQDEERVYYFLENSKQI